MFEEIELCREMTEEQMQKALTRLDKGFQKIRTGKASPSILDGIRVEAYGAATPIAQLANINTPDARQIVIQPWDKSLIIAIEREILNANLGFTPQNNGELIRIKIPILTEERRRELAKQAKNEAENAKIAIRNARRDAMNETKNMKKEGIPEDSIKKFEEELQKMTDDFIKRVDQALELKDKDIMTV
ncbi:MAG: ribosome recycling factor [Bacteroidales bacterium]|jgi:ribosome recycling factor|nr:ribosome recycling factor [Bacteroidales bacterium]